MQQQIENQRLEEQRLKQTERIRKFKEISQNYLGVKVILRVEYHFYYKNI